MITNRKKLNRKELVEHIRSIMPEALSETQKSAFIEKQIADNVFFDEGALWSDRETKRKIYRLAKEEAKRPQEETKRKLICVNMAELYNYVARTFGLNVEYQRSTSGNSQETENEIGGNEVLDKINESKLEHVCPVLRLSDGRKIRVDIQGDLYNLKTRSRAIGFGTKDDDSELDTLEDAEIDAIFREIYGLQEGEDFTDEYIKKLNRQLSKEQLEPAEKIKRIIEDPRIQREANNLGVYEAKRFYEQILMEILGFQIYGTFFQNGTYAYIGTCSISNGKGINKHSIFLYAQDIYDENKICYIFSKKNKRMVSVTPEEFYQMREQSMVIRPVYKSEEDKNRTTIFMQNAINSFIRSGEISDRQENIPVNMDEIFVSEYDEEEK